MKPTDCLGNRPDIDESRRTPPGYLPMQGSRSEAAVRRRRAVCRARRRRRVPTLEAAGVYTCACVRVCVRACVRMSADWELQPCLACAAASKQ
eukprot:294957-Chlamydomonas_euryale.AAC.4